MPKSYGVDIKPYHGKILRFNGSNLTGDLLKGGKHIPFGGVRAHHQNAVVESKIKEAWYGGRTILLHPNVNNRQLYQQCYDHLLLKLSRKDIIDYLWIRTGRSQLKIFWY